MNLTDHAGARLIHGKPKVNGVEIHYAIGGTGEPVFLLHGVPKTMSYWRHVVPLLTPHYTVIALDNRGVGGSQRPLNGYDTATMARQVGALPPKGSIGEKGLLTAVNAATGAGSSRATGTGRSPAPLAGARAAGPETGRPTSSIPTS